MTQHSNALAAVNDLHDMIHDIFSALLWTNNRIIVPKTCWVLMRCCWAPSALIHSCSLLSVVILALHWLPGSSCFKEFRPHQCWLPLLIISLEKKQKEAGNCCHQAGDWFLERDSSHISPPTCCRIYPCRLLWCELQVFGDISCRHVCPLLDIMELDDTCRNHFLFTKSLTYRYIEESVNLWDEGILLVTAWPVNINNPLTSLPRVDACCFLNVVMLVGVVWYHKPSAI